MRVSPAPSPTNGPDVLTAIASGPQVEFIDYADSAQRYSMKIPKGWIRKDLPDTVELYLPSDRTPVSADLALSCRPNETARGLLASDVQVNQDQGFGKIDVRQVHATQVGGTEALEVAWSGTLGQHVYVYFEGKGCAWRLTLNTLPASPYSIEQLRPVLDRVAQSFRFTA